MEELIGKILDIFIRIESKCSISKLTLMIREMKDKEMLLENVVTTIKIKGRMNTLRTLKKKNKIYSHSKK